MSMLRAVPLAEGTAVRIKNIDNLGTELTGIICGLGTKHIIDFYIVKLDQALPDYPYSCALITEGQIEEI